MWTNFSGTALAVQTAVGGLTQAALQASQTIVLNTNATAGSPELQAGGIPLVSVTNYPAATKHSVAEETWTDPQLFIEINKAYNQAATSYRV